MVVVPVLAPLLHPATAHPQSATNHSRVRPLAVSEALAVRGFSPGSAIALSPDGRLVAYIVGAGRPRSDTKYRDYDSTGAASHAGDSLLITDTHSRHTVSVHGGSAYWAPAWSPDGRFLAFCSERGGKARLWVWQRGTARVWPAADVTVLVPTTWPEPPRWMPDSRHVLVKVLPAGMTVAGLLDEALGRSVVADPSAMPTDSGGPSVTVYESPPRSGGPGRHPTGDRAIGSAGVTDSNAVHQDYRARLDRGDLALIDVMSRSARRLTHLMHPGWYMPSPGGHAIAFADNLGLRGGNNWRRLMDLYVVSLRDSATRLLVPRLQQEVGKISWSPDGRWLAYTQFGQDVDGELYVVAGDGGKPVRVSRGSHASFNIVAGTGVARVPLWARDGASIYMVAEDTLWRVSLQDTTTRAVSAVPGHELVEVVTTSGGHYWSPDSGRSMYVKVRNTVTEAMGYARINLASGRTVGSHTEPKTYGSIEWSGQGDAADQAPQFVYVSEDIAHPPDLWVSDTMLNAPAQLTSLNSRLDGLHLGASELISWRGLDGRVLRGALLLPADYCAGQRYPLLVKLWGGESSAGALHQFGLNLASRLENMQLFASRGYAVLLPDAPQSSQTPMLDLAKNVLPGVDRAIELGVADPDRLGVMGHSYGGYSALALLVQTNRFKAAVSSAAPANWFTLYGELSPGGDAWGVGVTEDGQGLMRATPWEAPFKYFENSPYFYLNRVQTPLLMMQGSNDEGVYAFNSDEVFVGLRRLGKPAVYLKYAGEGHFLGRAANQADYLTRVIRWFEDHLNPQDNPCTSTSTASNCERQARACPSRSTPEAATWSVGGRTALPRDQNPVDLHQGSGAGLRDQPGRR